MIPAKVSIVSNQKLQNPHLSTSETGEVRRTMFPEASSTVGGFTAVTAAMTFFNDLQLHVGHLVVI